MEISEINEKSVSEILFRFIDPNEFKIFIFGSRVTGRANEFSDYDVGIIGKRPVSLETIALAKEAFEESNLLFKVDIVDFSLVSDKFRRTALSKIKEL